MRVDDFDYLLPEDSIAKVPAEPRDSSRLMVLQRDLDLLQHRRFDEIGAFMKPGDCLVVNDSKVLPARLFGVKTETGVQVEFLLIRRVEGDRWETMVRPGRRLKPGDVVRFGPGLAAKVEEYGTDGTRIVRFSYEGAFMDQLETLGQMPLPPYIDRPAEAADKERYQTVYCRTEGSVAAPTAGLHFTDGLLERLEAQGIRIARVTLHVGIGTFRPVKADLVEDHVMHFEEYEVTSENAGLINRTKDEGGRVIAVGTTSARTLESSCEADAAGTWRVRAGRGSTGIFIYPGYAFRIIDGLVTNFHLPKSTLLMLVSAFYDRRKILMAYEEAVREGYRFFSYGDAMLIL